MMTPWAWALYVITGLQQVLFLTLAARDASRWRALQWYAGVLFASTLLEAPLLIRNQTAAYFYTYWACRTIILAVEIWLLISFSTRLFETLFEMEPRHIMRSLWLGSAAWSAALAMMLHLPISTANPYTRFVIAFERGTAHVEAAALIVVGVVFFLFPTRLPRRLGAIGAALTFQFATQLIVSALLGILPGKHLPVLQYLAQLRDVVVLGIWIYAIKSRASLDPIRLCKAELERFRCVLQNYRQIALRSKGPS